MQKTQITLGFIVERHAADKLCHALDCACELAHGNFKVTFDHGCTTFIAPRLLGLNSFRIAKALVDGFRLGVFS
jgi:hypothetical protein